MNVVLVILDTLRQDHVGCYGNEWIKTPYLDALAKDSVVFSGMYPDSLPTLPVRRALQTGCRIFPFRDHQDYRGTLFKGTLGWGPVAEDRDTMAELLQAQGYRTAFITDTYHQFKPSMNFHRGFDEWRWVRGQENDPYRSGPLAAEEQVRASLPDILHGKIRGIGQTERFGRFMDFARSYLTNVADRAKEEDYFPARVFQGATEWLDRNQDAEKFFLVVDSFDPHEPWDPPGYYRRLYDNSDAALDFMYSLYGAADQLEQDVLRRLRMNYAGEVTLVDRWFGYLLEKLKYMGLMDDTIIAVISDHGHCIGEHNLVGKQSHPMSREIADLVAMIYHPDGQFAGQTNDRLMYNFDLTSTLLARLGVERPKTMEGKDIWPLLQGTQKEYYDHITCAWGPVVMVRDYTWWYNAYLWGDLPLLFDLEKDPRLEHNVAEEHPDVCEKLRQLAVEDAGGSVPDYIRTATDRPGCSPLLGY